MYPHGPLDGLITQGSPMQCMVNKEMTRILNQKFILQLNLYGPSVLLVKKQLLFALDLDKQTCWKKMETRELHGVVVI